VKKEGAQMKAQRNSKWSIVIAAFVGATAVTTANAQLFQMEFTAVYDQYSEVSGPTTPGFAYVSGTVVWDSQAPSTSNNGVNSHKWDYLSFEGQGSGCLPGGAGFILTISHGPSDGNSSRNIQTVHITSQNSSNMYWRASPEFSSGDPGVDVFGGFNMNTLGVQAMPDFTSPLPDTAADYEGTSGFDPLLYVSSFDFDTGEFTDGDFHLASVTVVITPFEPTAPECPVDMNEDGTLDIFDVFEFIAQFNAGCP
jgi:hypothetical protein